LLLFLDGRGSLSSLLVLPLPSSLAERRKSPCLHACFCAPKNSVFFFFVRTSPPTSQRAIMGATPPPPPPSQTFPTLFRVTSKGPFPQPILWATGIPLVLDRTLRSNRGVNLRLPPLFFSNFFFPVHTRSFPFSSLGDAFPETFQSFPPYTGHLAPFLSVLGIAKNPFLPGFPNLLFLKGFGIAFPPSSQEYVLLHRFPLLRTWAGEVSSSGFP